MIDLPSQLGNWLWDFNARVLTEAERTEDSPYARTSRRGFSGALYKTDACLQAHPFSTVPAAFSGDGRVGIFESGSILRASPERVSSRSIPVWRPITLALRLISGRWQHVPYSQPISR